MMVLIISLLVNCGIWKRTVLVDRVFDFVSGRDERSGGSRTGAKVSGAEAGQARKPDAAQGRGAAVVRRGRANGPAGKVRRGGAYDPAGESPAGMGSRTSWRKLLTASGWLIRNICPPLGKTWVGEVRRMGKTSSREPWIW